MHIRALERTDLADVHKITNEQRTMAFWFEEPYESLDELTTLYDKHIHDVSERRFVIEVDDAFAGIVELVDIDFIHRHCEIQIAIIDGFQGKGLASASFAQTLDYAFKILNMYKVYLYVDVENYPAVHIYEKLGFKTEGQLIEHFFANGNYHNSYVMGIFQRDWSAR